MTLPPCIINLTPPHYCPPGQHWNGAECVDDTSIFPPDTDTPGLVYFACYKGIAVCINPFSAPQWFAINNGFTNDSSKHVNAFNLDPWSFDLSRNCYTRAWTISNDGVWRGDGLPNSTWTLKLSQSGLNSLLGAGTWTFTNCLALDVLNKDHIYLLVGGTPGGSGPPIYIVWSENAGETWQGGYTGLVSNGLDLALTPSQHISGVFYITGHIGDYSNMGTWKSTTLPSFIRLYWTVAGVPTNVTQDEKIVIPYSDDLGNLNANDALAYYYDGYADAGNLVKVANLNLVPTPTGVIVLAGSSTWRNTPFIWTKNSRYLIVARHNVSNNTLKISQDGAATFSDSIVADFSTAVITNLFIMPADYKVFFTCGEANTNSARVVYTQNFGISYTRIDNPLGGSLDSVLGITTDDCGNAFIMADGKSPELYIAPGTAKMVDVSHWQGTMNWATAAGQGIAVAFMKATQGASYTDPQFSTNWSGAGTQGIARGSYHYFENTTNPTTQANHYVTIATSAGEKGYAVDCEDETAALDPVNLKTFLDRVETLTGQKCTIYTRASWWNKYVGYQSWASQYPLWVAHWNAAVPTLPTGWMNYVYWQFSSLGSGSQYGAQSTFIDLNKVLV